MKVRKLLAGFLSAAMVLGTMSFPAFAASDTLPEAVDGVITLTEDVKLGSDFDYNANGGSLTIDLAGYSLKLTGNTILKNGVYTIKNGTVDVENVECTSREGLIRIAPHSDDSATLNMDNVTVKANGYNAQCGLFQFETPGKLNLNKVTINAANVTDGYGVFYSSPGNPSSLTMNEVTMTVTGANKLIYGCNAVITDSNISAQVKKDVFSAVSPVITDSTLTVEAGRAVFNDANVYITTATVINSTITPAGTLTSGIVNNTNASSKIILDSVSDIGTKEGVCTASASIGSNHLYSSLADALAAAKDGDTISLIYNEGDAPIAMNGALYGNKTVSITGDAVVDWSKGSLFVGRGGEGNGKLIFDNANLTSTEASLKNGTYGIHVSMEEYGASNKADGEVVFKNSNIDLSYLMNKNNVTVDGGNLTVWYGFAVGARPASETNNVQRAAELKLSNNAVVEVKNHNGMGIGYESNGIANIDAGSTLKISAASLAVAANSTVNSKGNIIGLLDVADGATMNFTDGFYTEDPSAYCAEGYEVDKSEVEGYAYTVVPKAAQKINVVFENGKNEGEYILKLKSADEKEIYKFVSAELTFKNNSESLGDAIGTLPFEFVENTNIDVEKSLEDANTYAFALKNPANRITATEIELGTIKFTSQGTPALAVTAGTVVATRYNTNLPKYYSTDAELNGEGLTLDISATLNGKPVPDTTRDVAVKIEYNLGLVGGVWADDEIEVTLVDKFGDEVTATKVSNGLFTFEDVATGRIEVKLSAPGFRTYTYDAILYETEEENNPLVLNFWNNVKTGKDEDPLKKIDDSNAIEKEMAHNFVVGDIVMDFIVDRYDLAAVTSYYGMYNITERTNASEKYLKYDLNRDGNIDIIDVHYVLHTFGN